MTMDVKAAKDTKYGMAQQSAMGTVVADNAAVDELSVDHFEIEPDIRIETNDSAHGTREKTLSNLVAVAGLALPRFSLSGMVNLNNLDRFAISLFQTPTSGLEAATTPYLKTILRHATQPDFTAPDGYMFTIFEKDPVYAVKAKDCLCESLKLSYKVGEYLKYTAGFVARGNPVTCTPSGTWTATSVTEYSAGVSPLIVKFARCLIDFAIDGSWVGAVSPALMGFDIEVKRSKIEGVGGAGGTDYQTLALGPLEGTFSIESMKDANFSTARASLAAMTPLAIRLGVGNATPGTDAGDFDIVLYGLLNSVTTGKNDPVLSQIFKGEILAPAGTPAITLKIANAIDRAW